MADMWKWIWSYDKKHIPALLGALALTTLAAALSLVNAPLSGTIVDRVILGGETSLLWPILGLMLSATCIKLIIRYIFQVIFEHVSQSILQELRVNMFRLLQRMDSAYFDRTRVGDLMSHMTGDVDAVRHFHSWVIYQAFENTLIFVFALSILFSIHVGFAALFLAVTPLIAWAAIQLATKVKPTFSIIREQFSKLNAVVQEYIAGNRVVKAFAREEYESTRFNKENEGYRQRNRESARIWGTYIPLIEFFSGLLMVLMISVGGILIIRGALTVGELVVFSSLVWAITNPLRMSGWIINDIQRFRASLERIYSLSTTKPALEDAAEPYNPDLATAGDGTIVFSHVTASYQGDRVIEDISFEVRAGQTVGIVGPTGSGKSTLMRLLRRAQDPDSGSILIHDHDIKNWSLEILHKTVGVTMQDVFLFSDSIDVNIAFADPEASREAVVAAAKLANADVFIQLLPQRYDTIVGERGVGLSGGQRQRVALARLFLANPPVMILDDTTSAVDIETEKQIQESIRTLKGTHTLFIVAHRLISVEHADLILVLEHGRIAQRGTHAELIAAPGYYREVWEHQNGRGA